MKDFESAIDIVIEKSKMFNVSHIVREVYSKDVFLQAALIFGSVGTVWAKFGRIFAALVPQVIFHVS